MKPSIESMFKNRSLRRSYLIFTGLAVMTGYLVLSLSIYQILRISRMESARRNAEYVLSRSDQSVSEHTGNMQNTALALSMMKAVRTKDYAGMADIFIQFASNSPGTFNSIYFGSMDGVFLQRGYNSVNFVTNGGWAYRNLPFRVPYSPLLPADYDHRKRDWFRNAMSSYSPVLSGLYRFVSSYTNSPPYGITASVPVFSMSGSPVGVLGIDSSLEQLYNRLSSGVTEGTLSLVDSEKRSWAFDTNGIVSSELPFELMGNLDLVKAGYSNSIMECAHFLSVFRKNRETGITLLIYYDKDILLEPSFRIAAILLGISGLLLVILLLVINAGLSRLTNPVMELTATMNRFSRKEFNARASVKDGFFSREISALAATFNTMADSISDYEARLLEELYVDRLTGLPNRHKLLYDMEIAVHPSLVLIDIDDFKELNDFFGYRAGDEVLKTVGKVIEGVESPIPSVLYKHSGDEYSILLEGEMQLSVLEDYLKRISSAVSHSPVEFNGSLIPVRVSIGASAVFQSVQQLIADADMALKRSRRVGRNFLVYDPGFQMIKEYEKNIHWARVLRESLDEDRVIPYFQPIMDNQTGRTDKAEALVRLVTREGRIISPVEFLDTAHKSRLYPRITRTMFEKVIRNGFEKFKELSINICISDIMNLETSAYIGDFLSKNPASACNLILELVESQDIDNFAAVREWLEKMKGLGVRIAIDDFGVGYSNFEHLLELRVDYLKIDGSLIRSLPLDPQSQAVVRTISTFAGHLGIRTIAEYVHSEEVYAKVCAMGIDYSQGYYIGEPAPLERSPGGKA